MNGKYLLDTNIIILLFANDKDILKNLSKASEVFIPNIAVGELYYGACKSTHSKENIERINKFIECNTILTCDAETAWYYGKIKSELKFKGKPIPENDIWIAATSLQHNLFLVTRDTHFKEVEKLKLISW